jgi:hypothetical protein
MLAPMQLEIHNLRSLQLGQILLVQQRVANMREQLLETRHRTNSIATCQRSMQRRSILLTQRKRNKRRDIVPIRLPTFRPSNVRAKIKLHVGSIRVRLQGCMLAHGLSCRLQR